MPTSACKNKRPQIASRRWQPSSPSRWNARKRSSSLFFNDPAPTEIYTLSLHDALPISRRPPISMTGTPPSAGRGRGRRPARRGRRDRKSTRLNSSHVEISYAVFCLKKKKKKKKQIFLKKKKNKKKIKQKKQKKK